MSYIAFTFKILEIASLTLCLNIVMWYAYMGHFDFTLKTWNHIFDILFAICLVITLCVSFLFSLGETSNHMFYILFDSCLVMILCVLFWGQLDKLQITCLTINFILIMYFILVSQFYDHVTDMELHLLHLIWIIS